MLAMERSATRTRHSTIPVVIYLQTLVEDSYYVPFSSVLLVMVVREKLYWDGMCFLKIELWDLVSIDRLGRGLVSTLMMTMIGMEALKLLVQVRKSSRA